MRFVKLKFSVVLLIFFPLLKILHNSKIQSSLVALSPTNVTLKTLIPRQIALGGRYSRDFFNRYGDLRHIRRLRFWPMNKVLMEKYEFSEQDATELADFLVPILDFVPEKRPTAAQCLLHPWISSGPRLLEPSTPSTQSQAADTLFCEKMKREKEETEVVEVGMGKIAINADSKQVKNPQSTSKLSKTDIASSSR